MYPPVHKRPDEIYTCDRLNMLWEKYPQHHEKKLFSDLETLLSEHESYREDFEDVREEYIQNRWDRFLIQLSWSDLPFRKETADLIGNRDFTPNLYVQKFMEQFSDADTDHKAYFLFPESCVSQFLVIMEACRRAERLYPLKNLFPDEQKLHYLAVFDKQNMDDVLLMFHLLYASGTEEISGGYSLYDYSLPWYQNHLIMNDTVLRSPYLPDAAARYLGALPFYHNPSKTVYVRRNIAHIIESGYFQDELEFFLNLIRVIMPFFEWLYRDIELYEAKDGYRTDWRLARTQIRTDLTSRRIIKPKWKHELTLFHALKDIYPDTLYQYRPEWLGRQSLDLFVPSLQTAVEFQGIQHYQSVEFFGGEEALDQRKQLDQQKRQLCLENHVRLIEWPYSIPPTAENIRSLLKDSGEL